MSEIVILHLPYHGTRRDLLFLEGLPNVSCRWLLPEQFHEGTKGAKLLILPGSSRTVDDLRALRSAGGEELIRSHLSQGGFVFGLCGGMQWLCEWLFDPYLTQGDQPLVEGLGLIPNSFTIFGPTMMSCETAAMHTASGLIIKGVEHRSGCTSIKYGRHSFPLAKIVERNFEVEPAPAMLLTVDREGRPASRTWAPGTEALDGVVIDGRILCSYIHLILTNPSFVSALLPTVLA